MRDCPVTWSVSIYCIDPGSQVYDSFLKEFPASHGDTVDDKQFFSSTYGRSVRKNHPYFREHATGMHPISQG